MEQFAYAETTAAMGEFSGRICKRIAQGRLPLSWRPFSCLDGGGYQIMGKLIFLDIDGTIVAPWKKPSRVTIEAIRAARANGHRVFISTGRVETDVNEDIRSIGFDGGIYNAGGRAVVNGTEILNRPMPVKLVQQITDVIELGKLVYMLEGAYGTYIIKNGELSPIDMEQFYASGESYRILDERRRGLKQVWSPKHREYPVYKIDFLTESRVKSEWLGEELRDTAKVVCFDTLVSDLPLTIGEVSDWDINKGKALYAICQYLNVDPSDCIAFGDSMNDAEILQAAGIGIAMANSEAGVKEIADQVCESCAEDGVAKAFARMNLI